jgi:hypothetical protein
MNSDVYQMSVGVSFGQEVAPRSLHRLHNAF